jgi:hypothetical protein
VTEWKRLHPGVFIPVIKNPYPAAGALSFPKAGLKLPGKYHRSVVDGKTYLGQVLSRHASTCRGQKILLTGYSQGAQVTADEVQTNQVSVIFGVALFGDPYFNSRDPVDRGGFSYGRNGWLGQRPLFDSSQREHVLSYCHYHDPVCQGAGLYGDSQHTNYDGVGEPEEAARYFTWLAAGAQAGVRPPTAREAIAITKAINEMAHDPKYVAAGSFTAIKIRRLALSNSNSTYSAVSFCLVLRGTGQLNCASVYLHLTSGRWLPVLGPGTFFTCSSENILPPGVRRDLEKGGVLACPGG